MKTLTITLSILITLFFKITICQSQTNIYSQKFGKEINLKADSLYLTSIKAGQNSGPGIKYTDIIPDDTLMTNPIMTNLVTRNLDLDGNGTIDFVITHFITSAQMLGAKTSYLKISPVGENAICVSSLDSSIADSLHYNRIIDSNRIWSNSQAYLFYYNWSMGGTTTIKGYWHYNNISYVGIRIKLNGKLLYGWIHVKCNGYYDFCSNIITQYCVTVPYIDNLDEENLNKKMKIFPNPTTGKINIETQVPEKQSLEVFDINGRQKLKVQFTENTEIDLSTLDNGIYFISIKNSLGVINKKVVIAK